MAIILFFPPFRFALILSVKFGCRDTQHNDTYSSDLQHNYTKHNDKHNVSRHVP